MVTDNGNAERQRQARDRVERQTRHLRWSRWADREMRLVDYYATWGWPYGRSCPVIEGWRSA